MGWSASTAWRGLVWPVERIEAENVRFRSCGELRARYMPFDHLLFFADAGNLYRFAFGICGETARQPQVFVWDREDDSRIWAAPSFAMYLEWWLSGKLLL
jgi:hypothetical protein